MKCGIVPIAHTGTEKTFGSGKNAWVLQGRAKIRIQVLEEVQAKQVAEMEVDALKALLYDRIEKGIEQLESSKQ